MPNQPLPPPTPPSPAAPPTPPAVNSSTASTQSIPAAQATVPAQSTTPAQPTAPRPLPPARIPVQPNQAIPPKPGVAGQAPASQGGMPADAKVAPPQQPARPPQPSRPPQASRPPQPSRPLPPSQSPPPPRSPQPQLPPTQLATANQQPPQVVTQPPGAPLVSSSPVAQPSMPPKPPGPVVPPPPGVKPPLAAASVPKNTLSKPPVGAPPAPSTSTQTPVAQPAKVKKSWLRFLPFALVGLLVVGLVAFLISRLLNGAASTPTGTSGTATNRTIVPARQTTITYWGLWEPSSVLTTVLQEFEKANPGIKVEYVQQSHLDYRERLQTAIAAGNGPDAFRFHASWVPMLRNDLDKVPTSVYSTADFQRTFYPIASKQLSLNGQLVGVPLMYDGLALYYNVDMLRVANAQVPTTWADLRTLASQLTVRNGSQIQRGGLAIGTTGNVEHFADILGLLMLQNKADPANPTSTAAKDALDFYTSFYKTDKVWSETLPSSTVAFARGDAAMMFAPSWRVFEIKALNPSLNFATAPVPRLGSTQLGWATYWAEGVNAKSNDKATAWELIKYMSSTEVMRKLHAQQAEVRAFGEIHSRTDLAGELASQSLIVPFLSDAPQADNWYLNSFTHDNGINDLIIKYYQDAINAVNNGQRSEDVLVTVAQGVAQILRQYGVAVTGRTTTQSAP